MANLGNAWHIPGNPEPRGRAGMRGPVGAIVPGTGVTIISGNQFQGGGNPGNQLQTGSGITFKRAGDAAWTPLPLLFLRTAGNNKYYAATIPPGTFQAGDLVQYYLRIAYDDHDTTFLHAQGGASSPTDDETVAQAVPFTFLVEPSSAKGQWGPVFPLPNVAIHTSVLPNGHVLMWGRRDTPAQSLDPHECTPFLWDPVSNALSTTPQPALADGTKVNLFCAGHAFLPNGHLLAVGGHLSDSDGVNQATIYDWTANTWTPTTPMNRGRWYPTAITLPSGGVLVLAGSYKEHGEIVHNTVSQVWNSGGWTPVAEFPARNGELELYPRTHVASDGRVFMSGPLEKSYLLSTAAGGGWSEVASRSLKQRDYCPAVMYDVDKVIYIGGGNDVGTQEPTAAAEIIDLAATSPQWQQTNPMHFRRRQHNATLLPDGTVLVTGGTRGGGGPGPNSMGFNDLRPGRPVHIAELWDPATESWTELAAEEVDRCYHATAVLLPDATVLSAGGGEYRPLEGVDQANDPEDSHRDAQVFSPPYLFRGARPVITSAPASVGYGQTFQVGTDQPNNIGKVSWVRLPSVTHAFDQSQRINFLPFQPVAGALRVSAPNSAESCPPGHYMLFILSTQGVPSVARIIQIRAAAVARRERRAVVAAAAPAPEVSALAPGAAGRREDIQRYEDAFARRTAVAGAAKGTTVVVGITGTCPYGIAACWGGAHEALGRLEGVDLVNPIPDADDSTAVVYLEDQRLPALAQWEDQFRSIVNGRYLLRGVEVRLAGVVEERDGQLLLAGGGHGATVQLAPLAASDKIQWDRASGAPQPLGADEALEYGKLVAIARDATAERSVMVTGPLKQVGADYRLHVRLVNIRQG